jgi:energy-converting hydrogenase Eha subunit C
LDGLGILVEKQLEVPLVVHRVIFWAALLSAAFAVLFDIAIGLGVAGAPTRMLAVAASLLLALSYVTLVSAIHSTAGDERVWTQIALSFALLYAALLVWNYYLQLTVVRTNPGLYDWLSMEFTSASAFWALETIGYSLLGLSTLCLLPVLSQDRLGGVTRWAFLVNGIFTVIGGIGYGLTGNPLNVLVLISLGAWAVAFPLGTALIALAARRRLPSE